MEPLEGLPDWNMQVLEVSAGVWRVTAIHMQGSTAARTGFDLDELLRLVKADAFELNEQLQAKRQGSPSNNI